MSPEDIATGAKQFTATAWGKWFLAELERKEAQLLTEARNFDGHEVKVNRMNRSAGIRDAIELITTQEGLANSTLFKK